MDTTRNTRRPAPDRVWALAAFFLLLASAAGAKDLTTVVQVDNLQGKTVVVLGAGLLDGMAPAAQVVLLREGQPIVHPITGRVLGTPQEPVGLVRVFELQDRQSRGMVVKLYSSPQVDDLAEFDKVAIPPAPAPPPPPAVVREDSRVGLVLERLDQLEAKVEQYRKSVRAAKPESAPGKPVWDEIATMKGYLTGLDRRLAALEAQQGESRTRLDALARGEYQAVDVREFTVRYSADTQVRLKVAGKTLLVSVERDSVHLEEETAPVPEEKARPEPAAAATLETPVLEPASGEVQMGEELVGGPAEQEAVPESAQAEPAPEPGTGQQAAAPWYQWRPTRLVLVAGIVILGALAFGVWYVIKRRYDDVMEGLEEFEEDSGDEEEDDEEGEEEEEVTPVRRKRK